MASQVKVGRRILGVLGTVILLPAVAAVALFAAGRFRDPDGARDPVSLQEQFRLIPDVEYGRVDGVTLKLDVYRSRDAAAPVRPAVLVIHGGGWVEGTKADEAMMASFLVQRGFVAFSIDYRLATREGTNRYPAAVLDARRAARWVRTHAAEFGADPARLGAVGLSAGAHLAAILGTTDEIDPADPNSPQASSRVDCVVDTAGPTDFTDDDNPPIGPKIAEVVPIFFGKPRTEIPDAYQAASPARQVDERSAPALIFHGTADDIVPIGQSQEFARALDEAEVEHRLVVFDGEGHGFSRPETFARWFDEINRFLSRHLRP